MLPRLRNPYSSAPDFPQLARDVPAFAPFLRSSGAGRATIDWKDDAAVRALTAALLERDFQLAVELPDDRLCPTVPSRLEHVLFVLRLALLMSDVPSTSQGPPRLVGLDIGTGASAIYPILVSRTYSSLSSSPQPALRMLATDIDARSLSFARSNIARNGLEKEIEVVEVDGEGAIFSKEVVESVERIDFTMCNPPFYASASEIASSLALKELEPFAVCTGASNELITQGGEVEFVLRMVEESRELGREKIRWFTSLLGKHSSIAPLVELLKSHQILNYAITPLPPQGQTTRWVLAWSLQDRRFPPELLYPSPFPSLVPSPLPSPTSSSSALAAVSSSSSSSSPTQSLARFLPPSLLPSSYFVPSSTTPTRPTLERIRALLDSVLSDLVSVPPVQSEVDKVDEAGGKEGRRRALDWRWDRLRLDLTIPSEGEDEAGEREEGEEGEEGLVETLTITARRNVWSRSARRAAKAKRAASPSSSSGPAPASAHTVALPLDLELRIRLFSPAPPPALPRPAGEEPTGQVAQLVATWTRGRNEDRAAFVGLWGYLVKKVGEGVKEAVSGGGENDEGEREEEREEGGGRGGKRRKLNAA
ncbi:hypothetical protein JCM8547_001563 [Rhodosporidiobolus lusitaniae]